MSDLHELVETWYSVKKAEDPYGSVEAMAEGASGNLWPYAVLCDQIESSWPSDEFRGALALNLAKVFTPGIHGLAALLTMLTPWPDQDATTALNFLALVHRCNSLPESALGRIAARASVNCLQRGLQDPRALISEEAANILGGVSVHQLNSVTSATVSRLRALALDVLSGIDDQQLTALLRDRIQSALDDRAVVPSSSDLTNGDARVTLKEIEPFWRKISSNAKDVDLVASLKAHTTAVIWQAVSTEGKPIEVVYVYSIGSKDAQHQGWTVIEPWFDTVRSLLLDGKKKPKVDFEAVDAMSGSLLITLRVEAEETAEKALIGKLKEVRGRQAAELDAFGDIYDLLRGQGLRIRVAHIQPDGASASISVAPQADEPAAGPFRSKRLTTHEIPQANDFEKIFALVDCVAKAAPLTPTTIGVTTDRQVQYYRAAARILSLLTIPTERLTRTGWLLSVAVGDDKYRRLRASFEASACGQAWLEWAGAAKLSDISPDTGATFLAERSELTGDTIERRASTINVWLAKLRQY